jgi:hypothetical protein
MALQIQGTLVCPARGRMAPPGGIKLVVMRGDAVDPGQKSAGPDRWTPKHVIATHLPEQSGGDRAPQQRCVRGISIQLCGGTDCWGVYSAERVQPVEVPAFLG